MTTQPSNPAPEPFDLSSLEDDTSPETLASLYENLDLNDPLFTSVDHVIAAQDSGPSDGLESRLDESYDRGGILDPELMNWRIMAPDDPKGQVVQSRIPDGIMKKVDHLISRTGGEIWFNRQDFMREAIFHYTRNVVLALQAEDPVLTSMLAEGELRGRATFHESRRRRLEKAVGDVQDYLTDLINLDDYQEAYRFVLDLSLRIRAIRIEAWRRHWLISLNSLAVIKVTIRVLHGNGWDIPIEFYPAGGISTSTGSIPTVLAPPLPMEEP